MIIKIKQFNLFLLLVTSLLSVFSVQATSAQKDHTNILDNNGGKDHMMNGEIIFDEDDMKICEQIIEHVISITKKDRAEAVIHIFTNDYFFARDDWIASFTFKDDTPQYYLYERRHNSIITITATQFKRYWQTITTHNQQPDIPIYAEE